MESSTPKACFAGRLPADLLQHRLPNENSRPRRSISGSSSMLLPSADRQSAHRRSAFRSGSMCRRPPVLAVVESAACATVVREDGVAGLTNPRTAGRLQLHSVSPSLGDVSLATSDAVTAARAGRQLCGILASVHPESASVQDVRFSATTAAGLPPALAVQQELQQLQPPQQQWLPLRKHQQLLYEHHQLRYERMLPGQLHGHHLLNTHKQASTRQHLLHSAWVQGDQLQDQQILQKPLQELHPSDGSGAVFHSAAINAPSFAAVHSIAPSSGEEAASERADTAATAPCPFERLRMLGSSNRCGIASTGIFAAADRGAEALKAQSNLMAELPQEPAGARGRQRTGSVLPSVVPGELPGELSRKGLSLESCLQKPLSTAGSGVPGDALETTASPASAKAVGLSTAQVVEGGTASAGGVNSFGALLSTPSSPRVPACRRPSPAVNYSQLSWVGSGVDRQTESRAGTATIFNATWGNLFRVVPSDSPGEFVSPRRVVALVHPTEATAEPLCEPTAGLADDGERCDGTFSAGHLPSSPTAAASAGTTRATAMHFGRGLLRRGCRVACGPRTSVNDNSVHTTADGSVTLSCAIEESDGEPARRGEFRVLSDEVRRLHGVVPGVSAEHLGQQEKQRQHQPQQGARVFGEESQQEDQHQRRQPAQQQATHNLAEQSQQRKQHSSEQPEKYEAELARQGDVGVEEGVSRQVRWGASVAFDERESSIRVLARDRSDTREELCSVWSGAAAAGRECSGVSGSDGLLHEGIREQIIGPFEDASLSAVEAGPDKTGSSVDVGTRCFTSHRDEVAAADADALARRTAESPGFTVHAQPFVRPIAWGLSCAATVAATTVATCETTDSGFEFGNPVSPAWAASAGRSAAADFTFPASKSCLTVPHVRRSPPRARGSPSVAVPSLPSSVRHGTSPQKYEKRLHQPAVYSVGMVVPTLRGDAAAAGGALASNTFAVQPLSPIGFVNLDTVDGGAGAPPTTSPAGAAVRPLCERAAEEASPAGYLTEWCAPTCVVFPWDEDGSPVVVSRSKILHRQWPPEAVYTSRMCAEASVAACSSAGTGGEAAFVAQSRRGFPSYPTSFVGGGFPQELSPAEAVLCTGAAKKATRRAGHVSGQNKVVQGERTRLRTTQWVSYQALLAQAVRGPGRSTRRRTTCGLTEERQRRQLRVICGLVGTLFILSILCRGLGILLFHTTSYATSKGKHHVSRSPKEQEHGRSLWNSPTADPYQVCSRSESTKTPSAVSVLSRFCSSFWWRKSPFTSHEGAVAELSACVQPAAPPAVLSSGMASFSCRIAHIAYKLLARLSARRRRSPDVWASSAGGSAWSEAPGETGEKRQQQGQREPGEEHHNEGTFARTRWRRRERGGSTPIGTLLLYIVLLTRKIIAAAVAILQVVAVYPVAYLLRSLVYVVLRISASLVCTAFAFLFVGRLLLERLKTFRIACASVPSPFIFAAPSGNRNTGNSDCTANRSSSLQDSGLCAAHAFRGNISGGATSVSAEASDASVMSGVPRSPAEGSLCAGSNNMETQAPQCPWVGEEDGAAATARADGVTRHSAADEDCLSLVSNSVALASVRLQGLAVLGQAGGRILRRSLHASKAVATHVFPLVGVAASAAASLVVARENFSSQAINAVDEFHGDVVVPYNDTSTSDCRDPGTLHAQHEAAEAPMCD